MKNYKIAGILITALPMFEDNDIDFDIEDFKNFGIDDIDLYLYEDWKKDPYFTLVFIDENNKVINFNNRTICRIYINKAEYKEVDINTDLILTLPLLEGFINLFKGNIFGISYMDTIISYTHFALLDKFGESIFDSEMKIPNYSELPVVNNGIVTYTFLKGSELYEK